LHATTPLFLWPVSGLLHLRLTVFLRGRSVARLPGSSSHNFIFLEIMQGKKSPFRFLFLLIPWEFTIEFSISSRNQKSSFASSFFP
jgi:hypothetical protein